MEKGQGRILEGGGGVQNVGGGIEQVLEFPTPSINNQQVFSLRVWKERAQMIRDPCTVAPLDTWTPTPSRGGRNFSPL